MKICHVITTIELGGAEKQLLLLARSQQLSSNEVTVVFLKGKPELKSTFEASGITVDDELCGVTWVRKCLLLFLYRYKRFDVFHAHLPMSEILSAIALPKKKLVISRHNTEKLLRGKYEHFSKFFCRLIEFKSTACIAISDTVRNYMISEKEWKNSSTIYTIYYGFDIAISPMPLSKTSNCSFLSISRLTPQKDLPTLLRAFKIHVQKFPKDSLTIIGDGPDRSNLEKLVKDFHIRSNVRIMPKTHQVAEEIALSQVFVLSSRYEGFGLVLLESMAIGRPILAASNDAVKEVMGQTHPGLFSVGDYEELARKMEVARDYSFQLELIKLQNQNLNRFDIEQARIKTEVIYRSLKTT